MSSLSTAAPIKALRGLGGDISACVQQIVSRDLDRGRPLAAVAGQQ